MQNKASSSEEKNKTAIAPGLYKQSPIVRFLLNRYEKQRVKNGNKNYDHQKELLLIKLAKADSGAVRLSAQTCASNPHQYSLQRSQLDAALSCHYKEIRVRLQYFVINMNQQT